MMNHNGPQGADFALVNLDDKDKVFHLIEVQREVTVPRPTASNMTKPIKSPAITETNNSPNK
jgi:hypothetical protein